MIPTIQELAELARAHPAVVRSPRSSEPPKRLATEVTRCRGCGAPLSLKRPTCRFCRAPVGRGAQLRGQRARRVAPIVRSEERAHARANAARRALEQHRRIHPAITALYVVLLALMAVALADTYHVVIPAIVAGFGASLYVIVHQVSADRDAARARAAGRRPTPIEILIERCDYCGGPMRIRARWPTCDFCTATGAPTQRSNTALERRAADAKSEATKAHDALYRAHDEELGSALRVAEVVACITAIVLIVASLLDALH